MNNIITGFHAIEEKVRANSQKCSLYYSKPGPRIKKILEAAKKAGIKANQVDDAKLDELVSSLPEALQDHRGIVMQLENAEKNQNANIVDFERLGSLKPQKMSGGDMATKFPARILASILYNEYSDLDSILKNNYSFLK